MSLISIEDHNEIVAKLKAEVNHWKANHDNQVAKARLLMDRPDLPVERTQAYKAFEAMQADNAALKAENERLKAENAEVKTRFGELLQQEFRGHQLQDRMMFTTKGREIIDWWIALDKSAIAKARGES